MKHVRQNVGKRFRVAGHFQRDVKAFLHRELVHRVGHFLSAHVQREIGSHFAREIEAIRVHVRDHDVPRACSFANRNCHATDGASAGDEHIFPDQIKRERSVNRVPQRIETGKHIERNRRIGVPAVVLRNRHKLRPRTGTIHAHALRVWAKMPAPGKAIPAMSTGDVSLAYYEIAARKTFHVIADSINDAHKLVADRHRHRDRFLRPGVPVVDVHVRSTDRCFQHSDEHIVAAGLWNRNFLEPETRLRFGLYNGLHHFLHNGKLGQSGKQRKSFASGTESPAQA